MSTGSEDPDRAASYVIGNAQRLMDVAGLTAVSFGLMDGAHRAIANAKQAKTYVRQCAIAYRAECLSMTVLRLAQLLDHNPKREPLSFQSVYRRLSQVDVLEELVQRTLSQFVLAGLTSDAAEDEIRYSVSRFVGSYRAIDWGDTHGRLKDFRNRGVAHLAPDGLEHKMVTYKEIDQLVRTVVTLRECLMPFAPRNIPFYDYEIQDWSNRAAAIWSAALRPTLVPFKAR